MIRSINRKKTILRLNRFLLVLFAIQFSACSDIKERSNQLLTDVTNYEIGQDRTKLTEFNELVVEASESESQSKIVEESIIQFLTTDATWASKQFVCRELSVIGSEKAVSVLTEMLSNEQTSDMARYALERIPDDKVDEALIQSLDSENKNIKIGIINTLGVRECRKAASKIAELIKSEDQDIAIAAATALGSIKGDESIKYLTDEFNNPSIEIQNAVYNSYLLCVDEYAVTNPQEANIMYRELFQKDVTVPVQQAAFVGYINTSQNKGEVIYNSIIRQDEVLKYIAISKIRELPTNYDITKFAKLLPKLSDENQIQLLSVMEDRAEIDSKEYVLDALNSKETLVRIASLKVLSNLGDGSDVLTIAAIASRSNGDEKRAARECLDLMSNKDVNKVIAASISKADDNLKLELIRTTSERGAISSFEIILENTKSKNRKIRTSSYLALAEITTEKTLPILINNLYNLSFENDRKRMEKTILKVLTKYQSEEITNILLSHIANYESVENKASSLKLLGYTNNKEALKALRKNINSDNDKIKIAAIEGISSWSSPEPLYDLLEVTENAKNNRVKQPALEGFINFIDMDQNLSDTVKIKLYKKALNYSSTVNEKNLILNGIGHIENFESLPILKQYYNDPSVKKTVEDGINRVCWYLADRDPVRVKAFIHEIMKITSDEKYYAKSQKIIDRTNKLLKE